jgi:D-tyrosyl-tRNA(Tyr) deacylase
LRAVIQRVSFGEVVIANQSVAKIDNGLVVLLGVENGDGQKEIQYLSRKTVNLRIFADSEGKMNLSVLDINGKIIVVSQFTLMADTRKGNRPSFIHAAPPDIASPLVDNYGIETQPGEFGANMLVKIHNNGPVTILIDT